MKYDNNIPLPSPVSIVVKLRGMKIKQSFLFTDAGEASVRTVASRIKAATKGRFKFTVSKEPSGIRVWRTA